MVEMPPVNDEVLILGAVVGTLVRLKELLVPRLRVDNDGDSGSLVTGW